VSTAAATAAQAKAPRKRLSTGAKRGIGAGAIVVVLGLLVLGTRFVPADDPLLVGVEAFDPAVFGEENFPTVQETVEENAVDAATLAEALAADPDAAASEYAVQSSGGPVYSTTFTGVVGEGQSGIYEVAVEGLPQDLLIRVQTGPAINGTELRDATGEIQFGQFTNQIDFQNAATALNDQLRTQVLEGVDTANLSGQTITVTGAFTSINPASWLVTPVQLEVQ
jgi:predicted lipoprotein